MPATAQRLYRFTESIIREMTHVARQHNAINLSQRFPDFDPPVAKEVGVAAVPGSSFFAEPVHHLIRFHYAKKEETLHAAGERLLRLRLKA